MVVQTGRYTIDDFEDFIRLPENADRLFELIQGEIVEKMPTDEHGSIAAFFATEFNLYKRQHNIKGRVGVEVRHQAAGDQKNAYLPDVAFRFTDEPPVTEGAVMRMPDIAVEILSPDDSLRKLRENARYYLQHESRLVWVVLPGKRVIEVYTPDDEYILTENDTLDGGDVLPGFTLAVKGVFEG